MTKPASAALIDKVGLLLRAAAAAAIMPRYRKLRASDTMEKAPGEIVTIADREAERIIADGLRALKPGAVIVGEEAAFERPDLLAQLSLEGYAFLIDPVDGTRNFASGKPPFSVMVALLDHGQPCAAWMLDPLRDELAVAERGSGAYFDQIRIRTNQTSRPLEHITGAISGRFIPPDLNKHFAARTGVFEKILPPPSCAGHEYPSIAKGRQQFTLYWRTLPWDHAPGSLFLTEAGGHVARLDGTPYAPTGTGNGLLAAENAEIWKQVAGVLAGRGE